VLVNPSLAPFVWAGSIAAVAAAGVVGFGILRLRNQSAH
jgi:hypothetical protein